MPKVPTKAQVFEYLNPAYHIRKMGEDIRSAVHALRCGSLLNKTAEDLAQAVRGRLFACFFFAGPFAILGGVAAYGLQFITKSPFVGLYSGIVLSQVFATLAFQIFYWVATKELYGHIKGLRAKLRAFERDVIPIQWKGFSVLLTFSVIGIPVKSAITWIITVTWPSFAIVFPIQIISSAFDLAFQECNLVRIMGNSFVDHANKISKRYFDDPTVVRPVEQSHAMPMAVHSESHETASVAA
jgi:hypothetical protein